MSPERSKFCPRRAAGTSWLPLMGPRRCLAKVGNRLKVSPATCPEGTGIKTGGTPTPYSIVSIARATASSTSWTWCAGTGFNITTVIPSSDSPGSSRNLLKTRKWEPDQELIPTASNRCQSISVPGTPSKKPWTLRCRSVIILMDSWSITERLIITLVDQDHLLQ